MATLLNPYLSFDGDARAAMEFYRDVFGGELSLHTFGDFGGDHGDDSDKIMHGMLVGANGLTLMGADLPPDTELTRGNAIAVSLSGDDQAELRGYWDKLSAAGEISVPLEKQMWGDEFGMCTDRFGVDWLVNISASA